MNKQCDHAVADTIRSGGIIPAAMGRIWAIANRLLITGIRVIPLMDTRSVEMISASNSIRNLVQNTFNYAYIFSMRCVKEKIIGHLYWATIPPFEGKYMPITVFYVMGKVQNG